jgi:hypothetical protein
MQPGERIEISVVLAPIEVQTPDTGAIQVVSIP